MSIELWDAYDAEKRPLGKTLTRGEPVPAGEYHIVVEVWTRCGDKILLTKRHPDKPWPFQWECSGGSVLAGETSEQGAYRELFEETGIIAPAGSLRLIESVVGHTAIHNSYLYVHNGALPPVSLQEGETVDFMWVDRPSLRALADARGDNSLEHMAPSDRSVVLVLPIADMYLRYEDELWR